MAETKGPDRAESEIVPPEAERTTGTEARERSPDEIQREIEETRAELADTAAAVAEKADVKKQAKAKVDEKKEQVQAKVEETRAQAERKVGETKTAVSEDPVPAAAIAGALAAAFLLIWLWRR